VFCVNDGAVMQAWAKDQGIEGSNITFLGDPKCVPLLAPLFSVSYNDHTYAYGNTGRVLLFAVSPLHVVRVRTRFHVARGAVSSFRRTHHM
jgi:hypothetical protein